jgi:uncharacterized membrane protein YphA (DoxX/SURF4 family)
MQIILRNGLAFFAVRVILGLVFVLAGFVKALDARSFLFTVQQLDLFPAPAILPAAIIVIVCEICFGLALLVGFQTRIAAGLLAALLLSFVAVIFFAIVHGKAVDCGCFGSMASERLGLGVILRDILLIAGCLWLIARNNTNVKNSSQKKFDLGTTKSVK